VNDIAMGHDEFARVLDRKQPLVGRDELDERFRQSRLAGPGRPADQDILARGDCDLEEGRPVARVAKCHQRSVGFGKARALARVVSKRPARASWSIGRVTVEGLRIVKDGQPLGVTDGITIWQRSPPGRTVEQIGVCPSMSWCVKLAAATASVPSHSLSSSGKSCHRHPAGPRSPPRPGG
jgi:hypothetical protein